MGEATRPSTRPSEIFEPARKIVFLNGGRTRSDWYLVRQRGELEGPPTLVGGNACLFH